jgi:hypothetical protein
MLFADRGSDVDHHGAGMFTRFVIERHGLEALRSYSRAIADVEHREPEDFEREFAAALGESLEVAWEAYLSEPEDRCIYDFWFCDVRNPIELPFEGAIECDDPDALGFEAPPVYSETYDIFNFHYSPMKIVHLELEELRAIRFEIDNATVDIGRCGTCSEQQPQTLYGDPLTNLAGDIDVELQPGTWAFIIHARPEDGSPRFAMAPVE